ncbi:MAG: hypothetical protein OXG35_28625 [Acidobacteria bacterium]|nr:hypothetical protein [Acidobacteriota bacterium]
MAVNVRLPVVSPSMMVMTPICGASKLKSSSPAVLVAASGMSFTSVFARTIRLAVAVIVAAPPSSTVSGEADSDTAGGVVSLMVTSTEFGWPAATDPGRSPRAIVKVSSSSSASSAVVIVPAPLVCPASMTMLASVP